MAGALITFAGVRCSAVRFKRTRGYDHDVSTVEIPVPHGLAFVPAKPGDVVGGIDRVVPDLGDLRAKSSGKGPPRPPKGKDLEDVARLVFGGTLCIAEDQGEQWQVVVHPLFVKTIERVKLGVAGNELLRVTLVDERFFWAGRGFLRRWSFNRLTAGGKLALDAAKPGGGPWLRQELAAQVYASLPRSPQLSASPAEWSAPAEHMEFTRTSPAVQAAAELEKRWGVEPPCLRLDGTIALHRAGDGKLGWAVEGKGPNSQEFPPELRLWKQGTGHGYTIDGTYPDDYVIVCGRERIQTVALDDCEPVLVLRTRKADPNAPRAPGVEDVDPAPGDEIGPPRVLPLDEATVSKLTQGRLTLRGLQRWILQPVAYQDAVGLEPSVARLLRDQAWRLWRIPKAETENAHLLPLLDRAEIVNGRRMPVTVQTFRFKARHRRLAQGSSEAAAHTQARRNMQTLRDAIETQARLLKKPSPFGGDARFQLSDNSVSIAELLGPAAGRTGGVSIEELQRAMDRARLVDRIREVDQGAAGEYEQELQALADAEGAINGTPARQVLDLGRKAADLVRRLVEARDPDALNDTRLLNLGTSLQEFLRTDENAQRLIDTFRQQIQGDLRALGRAADDAAARRRTGVQAKDLIPPEWGAIFLQNLPRSEDSARVYSDALGIVETSDLAGHVDPEGAASPSDCIFTPGPVRIIFGATVRPRADVHPGSSATQLRGGPGGGNLVGDLADAVTWFVRAFRRAGPGVAEKVELEDVPVGEGTPIPIDEHELIPLVGDGNGGRLEQEAFTLATERFKPQPVVESATYVLARPWPVQCDGIVGAVEISSRENGKGFEMRLTVGSGIVEPDPLRTRLRPPAQRDRGDAARREGLTP